MMRALILLAVALLPATTSAQSSLPAGLDHPDRAMALRPTGTAVRRLEWATLVFESPSSTFDAAHYVTQEWEGRIPIDSLLLEVAAGGWFTWTPGSDQVVLFDSTNVQLGASFRDAPAPGWRYEIGGAIALPTRVTTVLDGEEPPPPGSVMELFPALPIRNLFNTRGSGWNAHRARRDALSVVPHLRVELDPIRELVLGLEVDLPILLVFDGPGVGLAPQVAVEAAARFDGASLAGLRMELTSVHEVSVLLEPFVRVAFIGDAAGAFVRVGVRLPLGPGYPMATGGPVGFIGGSLEVGALL